MKKSLVALAVFGAFSGAALAQSNVTLYGIVDVNYQYNNPKESTGCRTAPVNFNNLTGQPVSAGTATCDTTSGINSGHQSGSRWGVRGSEALGGGLNAIFTLEGGYNIDTGTTGQTGTNAGARLFGRQAWAGLQGNWGAVVAGRIALLSSGTGSFDIWGNVDPFLTGFGDSGLQNTFSSSNALRVDNAIGYVSPTWGGFKGGVMYSFNVDGAEVAGSGNNTRALDIGGSFTWGGLYVAATYDIVYLPNSVGGDDQTHLQVGATYDFKFVKLHGAWGQEKNQRVLSTVGAIPAINNGVSADMWMVGVTVPLFGGQLLGSYQSRNGDRAQVTATTYYEADVSVWAVGYTYPLSRRTNLYASWSDKNAEKSINAVTTLDRSQFTLGMRHLF